MVERLDETFNSIVDAIEELIDHTKKTEDQDAACAKLRKSERIYLRKK